MQFDRFVLRSGTIRRSLTLLIAVAAIVTGILGMHALLGGTGNAASAHAVQSLSVVGDSHIAELTASGHDGVVTFAASAPSAVTDCAAGACAPGHNMAAMLCLVALLAAALLLAPAIDRSCTTIFHAIVARTRELISLVAPISPPSLHVLSISRT